MRAEELIRLLGLEPLPREGGWYAETYRSSERLPDGRPLSTAIYYLLTRDTFSAMHRLGADELWHFHVGDPVTMLVLHPGGESEVVTLGPDLHAGERLQVVVPSRAWQGAYLAEGGEFALMGTTMSPGWDERELELGERDALVGSHPAQRHLIEKLTRS